MEEVERVQKAVGELEARLGTLLAAAARQSPAQATQPEVDWLDEIDRELAERLAADSSGQAAPDSGSGLRIVLLETLELARHIVREIRQSEGPHQDRGRQELEEEIRRLEARASSLREEAAGVAQRIEAVRRELASLTATPHGSSIGRT